MFGNIFGRAPDAQSHTPAANPAPTPAPQPTPSNPAHVNPAAFNVAPAPAPQSGQPSPQPAMARKRCLLNMAAMLAVRW